MYEILHTNYEKIFPVSDNMAGFVRRYTTSESSVIDIGCATGELLYKLRHE